MLQKIASNYLYKGASNKISKGMGSLNFYPMYTDNLDEYWGKEYGDILRKNGVKAILADTGWGDLYVLDKNNKIQMWNHEDDILYPYNEEFSIDDFKRFTKDRNNSLVVKSSQAIDELRSAIKDKYDTLNMTYENYGGKDYGLDVWTTNGGKKKPVDLSDDFLDDLEKRYIRELVKNKVKKNMITLNKSNQTFTSDYKY
jgi:hypothetical protein